MNVFEPYRFMKNIDGEWKEADYSEIKAGDNFKMYDADGNQFVYEQDEENTYYAASTPFFDSELGVWFIEIQ
jgi:hypothetical protein